MTILTLTLKAGKDKAIRHGHPWIFSGAVASEPTHASAGATVIVEDALGQPIGIAAYSPKSQIRARVWSTSTDRPVDHAFFKMRVAQALALRRAQIEHFDASGGARLLHGESDAVPGVVCDRYRGTDGVWLVVQFTSAGAERWRDAIVDALVAATGIENVYERSDADVRWLEGLTPRAGVLRGIAPPATMTIEEHGTAMQVDIAHGHKTGFYLDQRENRRRVMNFARSRRVLNCFSYTGGFSLAALRGGALSVLSIDSSAEALRIGQANVAANRFDASRAEWRCADAFGALRTLREQRREFDLIVLDPPKLAASASHVERAARAYKDINLNGLQLMAPGGRLLTFSCSGAVSADLFQKIVAGAAADAGVETVIEARLGADLDHPVRMAFPEGDYLKGLLLHRRS